MTVLQVCAYGAPGSGNFIASLLALENELNKRGVETIYAFIEKARDAEWCKELQKRSKVYFLPEANARILPSTYKQMRKIFLENDIGIVHSHFELFDIPVAVTAPKNVKIFWHLHDAIKLQYSKASFLHRILMRLQYGMFSKKAVLLSTARLHSDFAIELGFNRNNVRFIPNGLSLDKIEDVSSLQRSREFSLFCWEFYRKGGDLAVEASKKLYETRSDFCVRFFPGIEVVENDYLKKGELRNNVNEIYMNTGAFLHISRNEGLSYALLEAIYSGLPVVCSNIPENMEVKDCPSVYYVENENTREISVAMNKILDQNFMLPKDVVEKSRNIIREKYSLEVWSNKILKEYFS